MGPQARRKPKEILAVFSRLSTQHGCSFARENRQGFNALRPKLYPLDQTTESLIEASFEEGTPAHDFAMHQFFTTLEQTVEELAKCWLLEFGESRELSFGRCRRGKSFDELYEGLKPLE